MCMAAPRTVAGLAVLSAAAVVLVYLAVATLIFKPPVAQTVIGALAYHLTQEQQRVHQSRYADNLIPQAA